MIDNLEQPLAFAMRQRCRRFIKDQNPSLEVKGFGNLDKLPFTLAQSAGKCRRCLMQIDQFQQFTGATTDSRAVNQRNHRQQLREFSDKDVFLDAEVVKQIEFLMYEGHSGRSGIARIGGGVVFSRKFHLAAGGAVYAPQDVHAGGLARAIFADESQHVVVVELETDSVQNLDGAEAFSNVTELENGHGCTLG